MENNTCLTTNFTHADPLFDPFTHIPLRWGNGGQKKVPYFYVIESILILSGDKSGFSWNLISTPRKAYCKICTGWESRWRGFH